MLLHDVPVSSLAHREWLLNPKTKKHRAEKIRLFFRVDRLGFTKWIDEQVSKQQYPDRSHTLESILAEHRALKSKLCKLQ
jgi:hypothetical protein